MSRPSNGNHRNGNGNHRNGNGNDDTHSEHSEETNRKPSRRNKSVEHLNVFWPVIVAVSLVFLPLFVYWCWICVELNRGRMLLPASFALSDISKWWFEDIWGRIVTHAWPTQRAVAIYTIWLFWQAALFLFAPGYVGEGLPCIDGPDKGKRLKYKYNGQFAFVVTLIAVASLHFSGLFRLTELVDLFGPLQTVCELYTAGLIAALYIYAWLNGKLERRTNSHIYDYFMGPMLNPRFTLFGREFDIKFYHELRPGIMQWFFTTIAFAIKQHESEEGLTLPMALICFYHLCFVNACYKGEQCVPMTMDIIYEKFGWMLAWLDLVTVPFIFPLQAYFLYRVPYHPPVFQSIFLLLVHLLGYWMFDTANSQKDYFREKADIPKGFPHLPWGKLENPEYMPTDRGTKLLLSGWWKYARHMNYTGDIMMSWAWGLTCGVGSYFPYAYTTYLTPLLLHRERRDNAECKRKYGQDWDKYCQKVPYRLIPYIY